MTNLTTDGKKQKWVFPNIIDSPPPDITPLEPTRVFDTYWRFAAERQQVFFRRFEGNSAPWTTDPILQAYKFTNAYRASDRVSQYLIRKVIYRDDLPNSKEEVFFRTLLFKIFNRIDTWELLEKKLGSITYQDYNYKRYNSILSSAMTAGQRIYSAAYIMPSARPFGHKRKHQNHLELINQMLADELPEQLARAEDMQQAFNLLLGYPTIGEFLAYQYTTDLNYSELTDFSEMEFVVAGPGAINGIRKCFKERAGLNDSEIIRFMTDRQEQEFERLGLEFKKIGDRRLQLIDCQNLFCEVDKYSRVRHPEFNSLSGRSRIKQRLRPKNDPIKYWYPPKWNINNIQPDCSKKTDF